MHWGLNAWAIFAICMAGIAVVILLFGGRNALQGLQNLVVITALPFALAVEPTDESDERATGGDFDSTAPEVTEWYTRTDEDGNPVEYDYGKGEYVEKDTLDG